MPCSPWNRLRRLLFLATATLGLVVPRGHAASILPSGLLEVDGRPFFPVGLVSNGYKVFPENWHRMIRESRANLVWDIEIAYADTAIGCAAFVDSAAAAGYKLLIGSGDTWHWDRPRTPELEVDQLLYEEEDLPGLMRCKDRRPGTVLGYANRDEPVWTISLNRIGDIDSTHVLWTYDQLKSIAPEGLVAMNFATSHLSEDLDRWKGDIGGYLSATDIVMFASYPYPAGPGTCSPRNVIAYPSCTMDHLPNAADVFRSDLLEPGQPFWMIVQSFKSIPYQAAKWQAVASIVHGVTGILWAGWTWHHDQGDGIDSWPVTKRVMSEIAQLQGVLSGYDLPGAETSEPDVEVRGMKGSGHHVLVFAISRHGFAGTADIKLPGIVSGEVTVLHEQRTLFAESGRIADEFDAYEAHIYHYQLSYPGNPTPAPEIAGAAEQFRLHSYPNPSSGRILVEFFLPRPAAAVFAVYDAAGRRVARAGSGNFEAGPGTIAWSGRDALGRSVAPGVYFVRGKTSGGESDVVRVVIHR